MNTAQVSNLPSGAFLVAGLLQLAFIIWIVVFPIIIMRKLDRIEEKLGERQ